MNTEVEKNTPQLVSLICDGDVQISTFESFAEANNEAFNTDLVEMVRQLNVGESLRTGGGAAYSWTIRRIS